MSMGSDSGPLAKANAWNDAVMDGPTHDVVAGLLVRDGCVLLCHRHPNREWYPNVWDAPGGHIESDETAASALRRELQEELGVLVTLDSADPFRTLRPSDDLRLQVWVVTDWKSDIENLAPDEHDELAWFDIDQLPHIDLADDQVLGLLLEVLHHDRRATAREATAAAGTRRHLTVVCDETELVEIARLRHTWDPVMAAAVPPHLTVVYPEEVDDFTLLLERARQIIPTFPAFRVHLGKAISIDDGLGGVFIEAIDETGTLSSLRERLLQPPFTFIESRPHVTVVHPRTSNAGPACWQQLHGWSADTDVDIVEISFTQTSTTDGMSIAESFRMR